MLETAPATQPESILWDDWHAIAQVETLGHMGRFETKLFDRALTVTSDAAGIAVTYAGDSARLPVELKYGFIWTCLGEPDRPLIDFPEAAEPDRCVLAVGSLGIWVSGLRLVENFLDLAHFPYVHTGYLGSEAATEVYPYNVRVTDDGELWVTDCVFEQPKSSAVADAAIDVTYTFRVVRPYTVVLEKTNALQKHRTDTIGIVVQPVSEEQCVAHAFAMTLDVDEAACKSFQRLITGQDKAILENQVPRRLPLDPRAELPVRADLAGMAYRRWLSERGVRYGAVPARP